MDSLPFEILLLITNEIHSKNIWRFELVCKRWRNASRLRHLLVSSTAMTIEVLVRYPSLRNYVGLLHLMKSDYLLTLRFDPPFNQGCIDPWIDLVIARPTIRSQFFHYVAPKFITFIDVDGDKVRILNDHQHCEDYTFVDRIRDGRPIILTIDTHIGLFPPKSLPRIIDNLNINKMTDELSIHVIVLICQTVVVKHCKVRVPASHVNTYAQLITLKQLQTTFTFEGISESSQT